MMSSGGGGGAFGRRHLLESRSTGHEKYPSWPMAAGQEAPMGARPAAAVASHRSHSWADHTDYAKDHQPPPYARPYHNNSSVAYPLKPVMERGADPSAQQQQYNPMEGPQKARNSDGHHHHQQQHYHHPHPHHPQHQQAALKMAQYAFKESGVAPLTQADLEEYTKKFDETALMLQHQKQSSYAHSEGYHSYVSSSDSSSTPFMDSLRRDIDASVVSMSRVSSWDGDSVVTTRSGSVSSSETLKWHGSLSDMSDVSASSNTSPRQLIVHSARVQTPQKQSSESVLYMARATTPPERSHSQRHSHHHTLPTHRFMRQNSSLVQPSPTPLRKTVAECINIYEGKNIKAIQKKALLSFYERHQTKKEQEKAQALPQAHPQPQLQPHPQPQPPQLPQLQPHPQPQPQQLPQAQPQAPPQPQPQPQSPRSDTTAPDWIFQGPIIMGRSISLDEWVPERPPKSQQPPPPPERPRRPMPPCCCPPPQIHRQQHNQRKISAPPAYYPQQPTAAQRPPPPPPNFGRFRAEPVRSVGGQTIVDKDRDARKSGYYAAEATVLPIAKHNHTLPRHPEVSPVKKEAAVHPSVTGEVHHNGDASNDAETPNKPEDVESKPTDPEVAPSAEKTTVATDDDEAVKADAKEPEKREEKAVVSEETVEERLAPRERTKEETLWEHMRVTLLKSLPNPHSARTLISEYQEHDKTTDMIVETFTKDEETLSQNGTNPSDESSDAIQKMLESITFEKTEDENASDMSESGALDLEKDKGRIEECLQALIKALDEEASTLETKTNANEELGNSIVAVLEKPHSTRISRLMTDIGLITSLISSLMSRYCRISKSLTDMPVEHQKRNLLEIEKDRLIEKLEDARILKKSINKNRIKMLPIVRTELDDDRVNDYRRFVRTKIMLLIHTRDVNDRRDAAKKLMTAIVQEQPSASY